MQLEKIRQVIRTIKASETRQAISNYFKNKYGFEYSEEEIIITNGASEALDTSLRSIIEPGDEILIPGPVYAGYIPLIETLGGIPIYMDTTQSEFKVTPELINKHITEKPKLFYLTTLLTLQALYLNAQR